MLNQRTFSDILSEINTEIPSDKANSSWESLLEPAWMSQLIGTLSPFKFSKPHHIYSQTKRPARKAHDLNESQLKAYEILNSYQLHSLHPGFYAPELKSAYRYALLKTHPDQGGTAETFQQVRKSYEILLSFVTK